jgi:isoleucyl-tRNA synthetase
MNEQEKNQALPKTIAQKEVETLAFWNASKIFEKSVETPAGNDPKGHFSFYDGPPFATGLPHHGHILAGTIKDAIPRYQTMKGNSVRRVWGWDCHGLPIENLIEKKLGLQSKKDIEEFGIDKFNKDAFESVLQYEEEWKKVIPRLGRFVDMDRAYKTMDSTYTESIWWAWKTLYEKKLAYEGYKIMHICPRCETTLAQSEVGMNYEDVTDLSVTAKFELVDEPGTFVLAWTTTPWTLPGNTALALSETADYIKVSIEGMEGLYILAKERAEEVLKDMKFEVRDTFTGSALVGKSYRPVFPYFIDKEIDNKENIWKIWHADFITLDTGTGIAHEAPAFGAEDMELAKGNNIPVIKHVKMDGTFTADVADFAGMKVKVKDDTQSADIEIIKYLAHNGLLFEKHKIIHSYPLCWRCKTPLLNYATSSWFVDVPKMKEKLLNENKNIGWTPEHIRDGRFGKWLEGAREWAVSRSRYWGAPLPVWKSEEGEMIMIGSLKELAEKNKHKPKNTYYAIRHGEAMSNISRILDSTGDKDNHLTDTGKEQARHAGHFAKEKGVDLVIASPFPRAQETAHIIRELSGAEIVADERLREFNTGTFSGHSIDDFHKVQREFFTNLDKKLPEGESHRDLMNRTISVLYECEKKYEGKTILFVMHGAPLWMLEAAAHLRTDEEIVDEMLSKEDTSPAHAHVVPVAPYLIPRDETGAVNLHRPYIDSIELEVEGKIYKRIGDVFDCWFESGSMPFASLHYPFENKEIFEKTYPADFIAEGLDQTRGWFYSLINLGVGLFDKAPYKHVIVNGLVMAESGLKLSKSEKNYTDPMELVEKYGADSVRYFLLSSPVVKGENVQFNDKGVEDVYKKVISRLENVLSLYEMNKEDGIVGKNNSENILDMWIVSRMHEVIERATKGYDTYMLDEATYPIDQFIDDLSVWYIRRSRDRLKGDIGEADKALAYATLTYILLSLSKVLAPVMPFIAERVYKAAGGEKESVHLESWPGAGKTNPPLFEEMKEVRDIVTFALSLRTQAKIGVRQPLQKIVLNHEIKEEYHQIILDELNVKEISHNASQAELCTLDTVITPELQAEGDVRNLMRAIQDARKEKGLTPKDTVTLVTAYEVPEQFKENLMNTCKIVAIEKGDGPFTAEASTGSIRFDVQ